MAKVATIEKILKLEKHPNADTLDLLTINGWKVVAKQGQYKEGDLCVYIAPDTVVEDRPIYDFLKNKNFRVKQIKLRGEVSNGLCLPIGEAIPDAKLNEAGSYIREVDGVAISYGEGSDVSDLVGAKHYEKPIPACLVGKVKSTFPSFLKRTDEDNLRSNIKALAELQGKHCYITMKNDGSSGTYYLKDGVFGVCSRNMDLLPEETNTFWKIAKKYDIEAQLRKLGLNIAIQGEVIGPGIQGNKLGVADIDFNMFNIFDIDGQKFGGRDHLIGIAAVTRIPVVYTVWTGIFNFTLEQLIDMANNLKYPNGAPAEGIVIRPTEEAYSQALRGRLSVKVISEIFAGKHGE